MLARWTGVVQDDAGNAVAGAAITVQDEATGALVPVFADRDGTASLGNPFTAPEATVAFHAAGGSYRVTARIGLLERVWRYVPIGTAGEFDADSFLTQDEANLRFLLSDADAVDALMAPLWAGELVYLPGSVIPTGRRLLKLNGATLTRSAYPHLWAYAQASGNLAASEGEKTAAQFGPGNGSTTFSLPDGRGYFLRAWDDGRGIDAGRVIGAVQQSQNLAHTHTTSNGGQLVAFIGSGGNTSTAVGSNSQGANLASSGGSEARPVNIAVLLAIRY